MKKRYLNQKLDKCTRFNHEYHSELTLPSSVSDYTEQQALEREPDQKAYKESARRKSKSDVCEMNGFSTEEETSGCHNQICCLLDEGERCTQPAGNASYNKRIQKTVAQKKLKLSIDPNARHIYICEYHKGVIQSIRNKRKRKESDDDNNLNEQDMDIPEVDLYQLQMSALRRYKRHYKIQTRQGVNKAQLAETLSRHFKTIPVNEKEAITYFIYMVKNNKNKLDSKNGNET